MVEKLVIATEEFNKWVETLAWLESPGSFNCRPEPIEEVDWHRFIHTYTAYTPKFVELRQLKDLYGKDPDWQYTTGLISVRIFWYRDCAYLMKFPRKWKLVGEELRWMEPIKFYHIGCRHKYRDLRRAECEERGIPHYGMFCTVRECKECGHIIGYDTS